MRCLRKMLHVMSENNMRCRVSLRTTEVSCQVTNHWSVMSSDQTTDVSCQVIKPLMCRVRWPTTKCHVSWPNHWCVGSADQTSKCRVSWPNHWCVVSGEQCVVSSQKLWQLEKLKRIYFTEYPKNKWPEVKAQHYLRKKASSVYLRVQHKTVVGNWKE